MRETIIIAEAGVNHNGSIENAKKLIDVAKESGADFVKFQTFKASKVVTKDAKKADYQVKNTGSDTSQYDMLKKLELSEDDHIELINHCNKVGIEFLSTPFDEESADYLSTKVKLIKIPSGELTNKPFIEHLAGLGLPIVLSTGMATLEEIKRSSDLIQNVWKENNNTPKNIAVGNKNLDPLTILHCTTSYPSTFESVNLLAMNTIGKELNIPIGYSDHTLDKTVPISAVVLGATIIEKHFTLDKNMEGPDHIMSMTPEELKDMIQSIRDIEVALGSGIKEPTPDELPNIKVVRKSLYYAKDLPEGHLITKQDLVVKRPNHGISPFEIDKIIGKKLTKDIVKDNLVSISDLD